MYGWMHLGSASEAKIVFMRRTKISKKVQKQRIMFLMNLLPRDSLKSAQKSRADIFFWNQFNPALLTASDDFEEILFDIPWYLRACIPIGIREKCIGT